jgi:hypothetical protein
MSAINNNMEVPADSRREVLMGYQYALHQHKKKLREEKNELRRSQENNSATSRSYGDEYSEMSGSSEERYREPKHSRRKTAQPRKEDHARGVSTPLSDEDARNARSNSSGSTSISINHAARTRRSLGAHAPSGHKKPWASGR